MIFLWLLKGREFVGEEGGWFRYVRMQCIY